MGALCYRAAQPNKTIQLYHNITLDFQKPWIFIFILFNGTLNEKLSWRSAIFLLKTVFLDSGEASVQLSGSLTQETSPTTRQTRYCCCMSLRPGPS